MEYPLGGGGGDLLGISSVKFVLPGTNTCGAHCVFLVLGLLCEKSMVTTTSAALSLMHNLQQSHTGWIDDLIFGVGHNSNLLCFERVLKIEMKRRIVCFYSQS
jgi:hypothetical protein